MSLILLPSAIQGSFNSTAIKASGRLHLTMPPSPSLKGKATKHFSPSELKPNSNQIQELSTLPHFILSIILEINYNFIFYYYLSILLKLYLQIKSDF